MEKSFELKNPDRTLTTLILKSRYLHMKCSLKFSFNMRFIIFASFTITSIKFFLVLRSFPFIAFESTALDSSTIHNGVLVGPEKIVFTKHGKFLAHQNKWVNSHVRELS